MTEPSTSSNTPPGPHTPNRLPILEPTHTQILINQNAIRSQWKGRRGKPRCDYCRASNLKCDRELPTCNHCSWATRECKYTPLPTPAHRGIPRCDRCRFHNLKCDRTLPVCNYCAQDSSLDCNYTPKKRHKPPTSDHSSLQIQDPSRSRPPPFLISDGTGREKYATSSWIAEHPDNGPKGRLPADMYELSSDSGKSDDEKDFMDIDHPPPPPPPPAMSLPRDSVLTKYNSSWGTSSRSTPLSRTAANNKARGYEPWQNAAFAPLPRSIIQGTKTVNPNEMPTRRDFDAALIQFLCELPHELREISAFPPDDYAAMAQALVKKDKSGLSERVAAWTSYHHARSGSRKYHLILLPREQYYNISAEKEAPLLDAYISEIDSEGQLNKPNNNTPLEASSAREGISAYARIPVSPQIYDVLVYCHKRHLSSIATLAEIRQTGIACITWPMVEMFCRLCPRCTARAKNT